MNARTKLMSYVLCLLLLTGCSMVVDPNSQPQAAPAGASRSIDPETAREQQNKAIVLLAFDELFTKGNTEIVGELFSEEYLQHNPQAPNGPEGLIGFVEFLKTQNPMPVLTLKQALADGDLVALQWHLSPTPEDEFSGQTGMDIFRLDGGKIVEHWDVIQDIPAESASGNSMVSGLYEYAGAAPTLTEAQEEANEQLVLDAYDGVFNDRNLDLIDEFWAGDAYIQHNPQIPNGTAGLAANFDFIVPQGALTKFYHSLADGDLVLTHVQGLPPGADPDDEFTGVAIMDLFRVVDGKIVEHWDVIQPAPAETASGNSMFSDLYEGSQ